MKRLGIFVFYDASGIVDKYVEYLLESMQNIIQKLIIIINGTIGSEDYDKLQKHSNDIYTRKNYGYDAGAYKDAFTKYLSLKEQVKWDEIILFNDTFYGPFYPWKYIFAHMEAEDADFWGLARHPKEIAGDYLIAQHIQSYFLVCRKPVIESECWIKFWQDLRYPADIMDAIMSFEVNFSKYFSKAGFKSKALTDVWEVKYNGNPSLKYYFELIRDLKFPIIKRRVFSFMNFTQNKLAINYIRSNTVYDVNMIFRHLERLEKERRINLIPLFDYSELIQFYEKHKRVYIYGYGKYGQCLSEYVNYKGWKSEGFIVTKKSEDAEKVFEYGQVHFVEGDGIILALGQKALSEVYSTLKKYWKSENLLLPKTEEGKKRNGCN